MLLRRKRSPPRGLIAVGLLAIGAALGWLAHEDAAPRIGAASRLNFYGTPKRKRPAASEAPTAALSRFALDIAEEDLRQLLNDRDRALARRVLLEEESGAVRARARFDGNACDARVRLKGDMLDHLETDQWSLRIELEGAHWRGMSAFSIQHPKTRGLAAEWLVLEAARREGLLAPRLSLVEVEINGELKGTYFAEEHFTQELLESQGRRDGPIVRFDERAYWAIRVAGHGRGPTPTTERAFGPEAARVDVLLDAGRGEDAESLQRRAVAIEKLTALRELARSPTQSDDVGELIDLDSCARLHALMSFLGCAHGLYWPNLRFYLDPLTGRLEPVVYDSGTRGGEVDPYEISGAPYAEFLANSRYARAVFEHLSRMVRGEYVDELEAALAPEYDRLAHALDERGYGAGRHTDGVVWDELRERQILVLELLRPREALSAACTFVESDEAAPKFVVEAWCTTRVPVIVESFEVLGTKVRAGELASPPEREVVLTGDGTHRRFELRTGSARDVELARALARIGSKRADAAFEMRLRYRLAGDGAAREERLVATKRDARWDLAGGRAPSPTLAEALQRHPFLAADSEGSRLRVLPGEWQVDADLALPDGVGLRIESGTTLRFASDAALIATAALELEGSPDRPIVLEALDPQAGWPGVAVLGAAATSRWSQVVIRNTRALERGAWCLTGGVTFHRSVVELRQCRFADALGEDALNVVLGRLELDGCTFERCASDAFDGDFVDGHVRDCRFSSIAGDALDLSGARVQIHGCVIEDCGDKGVSIGEASRVELSACEIRRVKIGVACKDASRAVVTGLVVGRPALCALAAYIKKPEFGPSSLRAERVSFERCDGRETRAALGCELVLDGRSVEQEALDVADF